MIIVCGEALVDLVPAAEGRRRGTPGGGPFNTARALARLEIPTQFLGRLSTDTYGQQLRELLVADGADLGMTSFGPEPTTLAIAELDHDGYAAYRFVVDGTSAPNVTPQMLPASFAPSVNALHVGTLGLILEPIATTIAALIDREHTERLVMVDPNIRPVLLDGGTVRYRGRLNRIIAQSTIVKASDSDVAWLCPELDLRTAARALLARGPRLVVVTLGADGAFGVTTDTYVQVPAPMVDVIDTIGAGDAFGAALLAWLHDHGALSRDLALSTDELRSALGFACLVASLTCTRAGAEPPRRGQLAGQRNLTTTLGGALRTNPQPQPVVAPLTRAAIFLVVAVNPGDHQRTTVRAFCDDFPGLVRAVAYRDLEGYLSCVIGFGSSAWDRLFGAPRPAELHPFREIHAGSRHAVSTPGDILFHIRGARMDLCFELATQFMARLGNAVSPVDEVHGFQYFDDRDVIGFVDGTENPTGQAAADATLIGEEDPGFAGGSYVVVQKYLHDMTAWNALSTEAQERVIGRTKLADIELDDAVKPTSAHNALTTITENGNEIKIVRDNMPFGNVARAEFGTYFIGYARSPRRTEQMLENMFVGRPPDNYDRLLDFSRAVTGNLFFVPSLDLLASLVSS